MYIFSILFSKIANELLTLQIDCAIIFLSLYKIYIILKNKVGSL